MPTVWFPHSIGRPDRYRKAESYPPALSEKEKWLSEKTSSCYWALTSHSDTFLPLAAATPSAQDILKSSMLPKKAPPLNALWKNWEHIIFFLGLSRVLPLVEVICTFLLVFSLVLVLLPYWESLLLHPWTWHSAHLYVLEAAYSSNFKAVYTTSHDIPKVENGILKMTCLMFHLLCNTL